MSFQITGSMLFPIIYIISSLFYIVSMIYTIMRIKHITTIAKKEEIRKEIIEYMRSEEVTNIIIRALNESDINKKINAIVLVLCTDVPELKRSKLCGGEI
ncbi:conserved lipothrixviral protein [Sulfolobus islandicus filamentous virus 2]|uniref:Conserved lipothrixviral protein n=1 Tax=Sulfolobus islandicus filamentous virus 2 TaxID=1902331 RepID=A0A1D8BJA0_SIFV|nr:conserved lipothrixviral protein [Sulfolobus islandicus filamentous virus 2]